MGTMNPTGEIYFTHGNKSGEIFIFCFSGFSSEGIHREIRKAVHLFYRDSPFDKDIFHSQSRNFAFMKPVSFCFEDVQTSASVTNKLESELKSPGVKLFPKNSGQPMTGGRRQ
jgi:hypothetical protein